MVITASLIFMAISVLVSMGVPIFLAVYFYKKEKISWMAVLVGALMFTVFQFLTRIPLLGYISSTSFYTINFAFNNQLNYLFLGFTAALFETMGRLVGFKVFLKNKLQWKNGVAYGIGHGGIEAIIIGGIPALNNLIYGIAINLGKYDLLISDRGVSEQVINGIKNDLINYPPYMFLLTGFERVAAFTLQIALSLFVLYAIKNKKYLYIIYAFLIHAVVDSSIGFISNIFILEGLIALIAAVSLIYILRMIKNTDSYNLEKNNI